MNKNYFLHEPKIKNFELNEVIKCLKTGWISPSGSNVKKFEKELEKYIKSKLILTNSGTSSLHLSLLLSGIKNDDEVLVPTTTFIATANAILYLGGRPIFFDNKKSGLNGDINKIITFLKNNSYTTNKGTFNKKTKKQIKALIYTHVFGNPEDLDKLKKILKRKKIKLIEDAAEALGSFNSKGYHSGTQGDFGILSFNTNKIITTSAGGALILKRIKDYNRAKILISQGKLNSLFFIHKEMGFNYGMTNINASIGLGQLKDIKLIIRKKKKIHKAYIENFKNEKNILVSRFYENSNPNFWLNSIYLTKCNYKKLKQIIKKINKLGIQVRPLWFPCHKQSYLKKYQTYKIFNSNKFSEKIICIPSSHFLNEKKSLKFLT